LSDSHSTSRSSSSLRSSIQSHARQRPLEQRKNPLTLFVWVWPSLSRSLAPDGHHRPFRVGLLDIPHVPARFAAVVVDVRVTARGFKQAGPTSSAAASRPWSDCSDSISAQSKRVRSRCSEWSIRWRRGFWIPRAGSGCDSWGKDARAWDTTSARCRAITLVAVRPGVGGKSEEAVSLSATWRLVGPALPSRTRSDLWDRSWGGTTRGRSGSGSSSQTRERWRVQARRHRAGSSGRSAGKAYAHDTTDA